MYADLNPIRAAMAETPETSGTGRSIRGDKRGAIPEHLAPILSRLGLDADRWCEVVTRFGKLFMRAAGTAENLAAEARRRGVRWLQGPGGRLLSAGST